MRSTPILLIVAAALFLTAQGARAGQPSPTAQVGANGRANPYGRLFQTPSVTTPPQRAESAAAPATTESRVVCGMTVIQVDPSIDRGIFVGPRRNETRYSMRIVTPPVCK